MTKIVRSTAVSTVVEVDGAPVARLAVLAAEIREKLTIARRHGQAALSAVMDAGDGLREAKRALEHGQWDDWLSDNFALSDRTARLYMQLAERRAQVEAKMATVATLGVRGALECIHEDQIREGQERRNREALAHELARRGEFCSEPPQRREWVGGAYVGPRDRDSYPKQAAPEHSVEALNAERVRRAVAGPLQRIKEEREALGPELAEQFDAELKLGLARLDR